MFRYSRRAKRQRMPMEGPAGTLSKRDAIGSPWLPEWKRTLRDCLPTVDVSYECSPVRGTANADGVGTATPAIAVQVLATACGQTECVCTFQGFGRMNFLDWREPLQVTVRGSTYALPPLAHQMLADLLLELLARYSEQWNRTE